jgi:arylsulfatase
LTSVAVAGTRQPPYRSQARSPTSGNTAAPFQGLYEGTTAVEPPRTPEEGYTLTEDLADRAITWVRQQKALAPDKPFFMYFAPGATHAPHHVPEEWSGRYKGKFDTGWDVLREKIFAEQKKLRVIPNDAELTKRHDVIPAWDDMPADLKPVARQIEIVSCDLTS